MTDDRLTVAALLAGAEAQRQKIVERRKALEANARPLLDIEWQFLSGMVAGAGEILRKLLEIAQNRESGRQVSRDEERHAALMADLQDLPRPERPDSTISGRPDGHTFGLTATIVQAGGRQEDDPDFGRGRLEFEAMQAERLGEEPRRLVYGPAGIKARDDGTYVLETVLPNCGSCDGRGWIDVLVSPHRNNDKVRETCLTCEGRGHL